MGNAKSQIPRTKTHIPRANFRTRSWFLEFGSWLLVLGFVVCISGVFAPLVGALVFKTSGRLEESRQWVRFPYTPVNHYATTCYDTPQVA